MVQTDNLLAQVYGDIREAARRRRRRRLAYGSQVCIRATDGSLLRLQEGTSHLVGGRRIADRPARFYLVRPRAPFAVRPKGRRPRFGQSAALRSVESDMFVGVDFDDGSVLTCWGGDLKEWETLTLCPGEGTRSRRGAIDFGTRVSIRVTATWRGEETWFVQYRRDTSRLSRANVQHVKGWETFTILRPSDLPSA